jgi:predicted membrane-bound mannosyltransferase
MLVFGSGALAGLLSSLLAYIGRTAIASSYLIVQDVLRVGAIIAAVGSGAAFLTGLNIMALMVPEASSTRPKSKPQDQTPTAPTAPTHVVPQTTRATSTSIQLLDVLKQGDSATPVLVLGPR